MENPLSSLKQQLTRYINLRIQDLRLEATERLVLALSYFVFAMLGFVIFFVLFSFLAFGLAEYLSALLQSRTMGYFSIVGIMVFFLLLLFVLRKKIVTGLGNKFVQILTQPMDKKNLPETVEEQDA